MDLIAMYYPYFRGKQYELIAVRESAILMKQAGFIPIIEPVKESLSGLRRALDAVTEAGGNAILVANPCFGDHVGNGQAIEKFISEELAKRPTIGVGITLTDEMSVGDAISLYRMHAGRSLSIIHSGFTEARLLAEELGPDAGSIRQIFVEQHCGKLYRRHFRDAASRILLRDGFKKRTNRNHPEVEAFSDLHVTFEDEGMDGFGDFLIVGDEYSETGGPAYAIAIHVTFIDPDKDDEMYVYHFVSDRIDTPKDPAGKFAEALTKLVAKLGEPNAHIRRTETVEEFVHLHRKNHFPGLGYVKKMSMKHHIETLAAYVSER